MRISFSIFVSVLRAFYHADLLVAVGIMTGFPPISGTLAQKAFQQFGHSKVKVYSRYISELRPRIRAYPSLETTLIYSTFKIATS